VTKYCNFIGETLLACIFKKGLLQQFDTKTYAGLTLFWKPGNVKAFGRGQEKVRKKAQSLRKVREFVQSGKYGGGNKTGVNCA